jgi:hypothetical protein
LWNDAKKLVFNKSTLGGNEMFGTIKGYVGLTSDQKELFETTFSKHQRARGTEKQKEFAAENLKEIKWDAAEGCLKVYYKNGDWWHYDTRFEWY